MSPKNRPQMMVLQLRIFSWFTGAKLKRWRAAWVGDVILRVRCPESSREVCEEGLLRATFAPLLSIKGKISGNCKCALFACAKLKRFRFWVEILKVGGRPAGGHQLPRTEIVDFDSCEVVDRSRANADLDTLFRPL